MPIRGGKTPNPSVSANKERHAGADDRLLELAATASDYLRLKKDEAKLTKQIKEKGADIKSKADNPELYELNGAHKEIFAPLGDGMNEIFIQLQARESVSMVDNVVDMVKQKLGKAADNYIMKVEVLHKDALASMRNAGLITDQDILDWTTTKSTESLIVKVNKKRA